MINHLKTLVLLGALSALLIGLGALIAPGYLYAFAALALVANLGAYFFSDRLVLRMHRAEPLPPDEAPEVHAMVAALAARAAIPAPRVYLIPDEQPNAFATGRNPARGVVAVTAGLLRLLDRRELRGVLAHEIAHIKNRDILVSSVAAVAASAITYAAQAFSLGTLFGGSGSEDEEASAQSGATGLLAALVAPLAATLIQLGISRSREYLADESAAALTGDPEALASALLRLEAGASVVPAHAAPATASMFIVNPLSAFERATRWFSTHPATAERVARLRALAARRSPSSFAQRVQRAVMGLD